MKKLLSLVLSLALAFSLCVPAMAASESMANFQKTATYNNQFSDVSASYWATPSIKLCYEYGFMKGTTPKQFSPTGALTVAEAIVMAARLHEIYTTGQSTLTNGEPWYQTYVNPASSRPATSPATPPRPPAARWPTSSPAPCPPPCCPPSTTSRPCRT